VRAAEFQPTLAFAEPGITHLLTSSLILLAYQNHDQPLVGEQRPLLD
jgi:hypothetical protein